jgi:type II secretory pathway predicted ATPase ExeA
MYESFYGLQRPPFALTPDPNVFVLTETHREALSNLEYGISRQKGMILLTGSAGLGKTTVMSAVLQRRSEKVHTVCLTNPSLTRSEFLETLATSFGLTAKACVSKATLLRELQPLLLQRRSAGETTVLIVDEAQSLSFELLEEIRLLVNIEAPDHTRMLSLVLAGQPQLSERLNGPELAQLKQRIELRCELRPLTAAETAQYILVRVDMAGGAAAKIFTRDAVDTIHENAAGIPRTISVLADNALLTAFALNERRVTQAVVLEVCRDFHLAGSPRDRGASQNGSDSENVVTRQRPHNGQHAAVNVLRRAKDKISILGLTRTR